MNKTETDQFGGRRVVITGAAGIYGRELSTAFAEVGARLCLSDIRSDPLTLLGDELSLRANAKVLTHFTDLTSELSIADLVEVVAREWDVPDIVINNAGIYPFNSLLETAPQQWDQVMAINLRAPFLVMQGFGRLMLTKRHRGCFINISSGAASVLRLNGVAYCVSKRALEWLSDAFALEFASSGIRVNCVRPGLRVGSEMTEFPPGYVTTMAAQIPLGRTAKPGDLSAAVMFLASDNAAYITGQSIDVNGGSSIPHRAGVTAVPMPPPA